MGLGILLEAAAAARTKEIARASAEAEAAEAAAVRNLTGSWQNVNEAMSNTSRAYQTQVTGRAGQAWVENGVKFDGMSNGRLIEVKGDYSHFVNNNGQFYNWFAGQESLVNQASNQLRAAQGAPIDWFFMNESSMKAVQNLFSSEGISGINFILQPLK